MNMTKGELLVFGLVVLVVLVGGLLVFIWYGSLQGIGYGGLGPGMMGPRMMGGFNTFGWFLPCLIPLGLLVLLVFALTWLLTTGRGSTQSTTTTAAGNCPNCHRAVQSDWLICPYCGASLREE